MEVLAAHHGFMFVHRKNKLTLDEMSNESDEVSSSSPASDWSTMFVFMALYSTDVTLINSLTA